MLTVETFKTLEEAIGLANDTEFGLTAGFYGKKRSEIKAFTDGIQSWRSLREPRGQRNDGRHGGCARIRGLEGQRLYRERDRVEILPAAIHAGAEPIADGLGG